MINKKAYHHTPVMLKEVLKYLDPKPADNFIDCTLGGAGYSLAIAQKVGEKGRVLAIDLDPLAIKNAKAIIKAKNIKNIILAQDNFRNLAKIVKKYVKNNAKFGGIVLDLGLSSAQLSDSKRGFSFQSQGNLSMEFYGKGKNQEQNRTIQIINQYSQENLKKIFEEYGEEKFSALIAKNIIQSRAQKPIKTTEDLVNIILKAVPKKFHFGKIHPATRVFQALRIETNEELESLKEVLPEAIDLLKNRGRIAVISYHSLEDRIVKNFFRDQTKTCVCPPEIPLCNCKAKPILKIITKKPLLSEEEEVNKNPRARSAKMRVAEKI